MSELRFEKNPLLNARQVSRLRELVGWDGQEERYELVLNGSYLYVACFSKEELIGFVNVVSDGVGDALICDLMVHPNYQQRGIGTKLMQIVIDQLKKDRIKGINVLFPEELESFYKKLGFHICKGGFIDTDISGG